ncbi:hypothetical protein [Caulobacter sp.]|uniref:hypothetical protein n=1 Tax=Caulobacter sp. TaxID=78 RepID=UPI003BB125E0
MAVAPPAEPSTLDEVMKAAAIQAASLALLNAVQHLQRTAALVEAAAAASLVGALSPGAEPESGWAQALSASQGLMEAAVQNFGKVVTVAKDLTAGPRS